MNSLQEQNETYNNFKWELIVEPELSHAKDQSFASPTEVKDHPLSQCDDSIWKKYYDNRSIWEEIEKDIKRTWNEIPFFTQAADITRDYTDEEEE